MIIDKVRCQTSHVVLYSLFVDCHRFGRSNESHGPGRAVNHHNQWNHKIRRVQAKQGPHVPGGETVVPRFDQHVSEAHAGSEEGIEAVETHHRQHTSGTFVQHVRGDKEKRKLEKDLESAKVLEPERRVLQEKIFVCQKVEIDQVLLGGVEVFLRDDDA